MTRGPEAPVPPTSDRSLVPGGQLFFARLMRATAGFWTRLGNLETRTLGRELDAADVVAPVYVTGLARAGTTIVTEMLAAHPQVASHRYSDFPPVWTPYWWNALRARLPLPQPAPVERAHRDRIRVTPGSPEAVEEVLWMHFFPRAHDPDASQVLEADTDNPGFERFYRDHVRKLLAVRGRSRYLAKGNYNLTRLGYLRRMFPDARFVIVVRHPEWHIASLMKQDRLFGEQHRVEPRVTTYLKLLGHFEFGVHKRPINVGDRETASRVAALWESGDAVRGWALYWASLHRFILDRLAGDRSLAQACLVVPYEQLCAAPGTWIDRILGHASLPVEGFEARHEAYSQRTSAPDYYRPDYSESELSVIRDTAEAVYQRLVQYSERQFQG